tara:strand:+ start:65 stop:313 length:249 start_codon:yes stop_codon:yes gene_type:complete
MTNSNENIEAMIEDAADMATSFHNKSKFTVWEENMEQLMRIVMQEHYSAENVKKVQAKLEERGVGIPTSSLNSTRYKAYYNL